MISSAIPASPPTQSRDSVSRGRGRQKILSHAGNAGRLSLTPPFRIWHTAPMSAASLRLQAQIFNLGVQSNLIYRWNFLLRVLVGFVPLIGSVFLWNAVFAGQKAFAGYTFTSMVAYFITLILIDTLTVPNADDFQIAE